MSVLCWLLAFAALVRALTTWHVAGPVPAVGNLLILAVIAALAGHVAKWVKR